MSLEPCHAPAEPDQIPAATDARDLIFRVLTVRRVAGWCDVSENAVHQWVGRGTSEAPIPVRHVPRIAAGAVEAGLEFDLGLLWPAMAGKPAATFRAAEGVQ